MTLPRVPLRCLLALVSLFSFSGIGAAATVDPIRFLVAGSVIDAEFHASSDRLVFITTGPTRVNLWDASTRTLTFVNLSIVPTCLSISPDGSEAVVGHDTYVTRVALNPLAIISTHSITAISGDIVHGGNGHAYIFPALDQWTEIHSLELSSGIETNSSTGSIRAGTRARLLPGTSIAYGSDIGSYPSEIERYTCTAGTAFLERTSPYHGEFAVSGDLWFNDAGTRILSGSGNLFHTTSDETTDMTYAGSLGTGDLVHADHGGASDGQFAVITMADDTSFRLYDTDGLTLDRIISIPEITVSAETFATHGKWIFLSQDGLTVHLISQSDSSAGLDDEFSIDSFDITPEPSVTITTPDSGAELGDTFAVCFVVKGWPPLGGGSVTWSLDGIDQGSAGSPITIAGLSDGMHTIEVIFRDDLGVPTGVTDSVAIEVFTSLPKSTRLATSVADAEFHAGTNRLIFISDNPPRINLWDATTRNFASLDLPFPSTCVSISPDGSEAVVGHDAKVTRVALDPISIVSTQAITTVAGDIVHGGNGFAYVFSYSFPTASLWADIHCLELNTGIETTSISGSTTTRTHARLQPGTTFAYGANFQIPPDIEYYDFTEGTASIVRDSPYHGSFDTGNNLWFNDAGNTILARSGELFFATNDVATDMLHAGALGIGYLVQADHGGPGDGYFAVIAEYDDSQFSLYNCHGFRLDRTLALPAFPTATGTYSAHGKWIFLSQDGLTAHIIAQADATAGLVNDFAIASVDLTPAPTVTITAPATGSELGNTVDIFFTTTAWPPVAGGSVSWSLDGVDQGAASSPIAITGLSAGAHTVAVLLRDAIGDPSGIDDSIAFDVIASPQEAFRLPVAVIDAEFHAPTNRLVFISAEPPQIHRWDAVTKTLSSLDLLLAPTCVSISPDGSEAAVGHYAKITRVDLDAFTVTSIQPITAIAGDIVHGGNGFAYVFPSEDQLGIGIHCLKFDSGIETKSTSWSIFAGVRARLRPGATIAYGAFRHVYPNDIQRYDLSAGTAVVENDSPYHGDYAMGGDLWFNDTGTRILTRSGNLFRSTDDVSTDMTYAGSLGSGFLVQADHGGSAEGQFAVITEADDIHFRLYDANGPVLDRILALPNFPTATGTYRAHGKWIFLAQDGLTAHIIARADVMAGLVNDFAIASVDLTPAPTVTITAPATGSELGNTVDIFFTTTAWPPVAGGSVSWSLDGVDQGTAVSPMAVSGLSIGPHTVSVLLRDAIGDPTGIEDAITFDVIASPPEAFRLPVAVVDAEFNADNNRLVFISADPPQIHRWDAATQTLSSLDLLLTPTCVSISPDGSEAVVGHDAKVTRVDLDAFAVIGIQPISAVAGDIVHGGNGFAYVFPSADQWVNIHSLELGSIAEPTVSMYSISPETRAHLRPGSTIAYGADTVSFPADIERYDFTAGTAAVLNDSPYHGDYAMGGDLWFNDTGTRILTRSGNLFRSSDDVSTDMTYAGSLGSGFLVQADHGGSAEGQFSVITESDDIHFRLYDANGPVLDRILALPNFPTATGTYPAHGKWIFLSQDGLTAHIIAQADATAGLVNDFAIASVDLTPAPTVTITAPATGSELGNTVDIFFTTTAWPPVAGGSVSWSLDGVDQGTAISPMAITGLSAGAHTVSIILRDVIGDPTGIDDSITFNVIATPPEAFRLPVAVIDAEFHAPTNRLVFISAEPPQIHRWDAATKTLSSLDLLLTPICVSISPDGSEAVVGHDARVTRVDLNTFAIISNQPISTIPGDIVHGGNGFAYVFPSVIQAVVAIHSLELESGVESTSSFPPIYAGVRSRLLPGTNVAYGANNSVYSTDIQRYDFTAGAASIVGGSPYYFSEYEMGGDLWFNDTGTRILTRSGNIFRSTDDIDSDMTYVDSLGSGYLVQADHGGTGGGQFAVITQVDDTHIQVYDALNFSFVGALDLPTFPSAVPSVTGHGRWVFINQDASTVHVIAHADPSSGLVNPYAILSFPMDGFSPGPGNGGTTGKPGKSGSCSSGSGIALLVTLLLAAFTRRSSIMQRRPNQHSIRMDKTRA